MFSVQLSEYPASLDTENVLIRDAYQLLVSSANENIRCPARINFFLCDTARFESCPHTVPLFTYFQSGKRHKDFGFSGCVTPRGLDASVPYTVIMWHNVKVTQRESQTNWGNRTKAQKVPVIVIILKDVKFVLRLWPVSWRSGGQRWYCTSESLGGLTPQVWPSTR